MLESAKKIDSEKLIKNALYLSILTIVYNLLEGIASVWYGSGDRTLALFGFGIDSFVEVISGFGILHLMLRLQKNPDIALRDKFENAALRITGISFYVLTLGLIVGAGSVFYTNSRPYTTKAGIVIAVISIAAMYALYKIKLNIGNKMQSAPVIADAECSKTCYYLSIVLLGSSLAYELAYVPYIDLVGGLGVAWFAYQSGKESFEKIKNNSFSCTTDIKKDTKD